MTQCLTLTALWSTHAHVFKRRVVNVNSKWDFPFIFCFIKWRQSFLHAIYYFVNDCTNNYYHLWHKTWNVGLCFIFTVKQHMPLNFNQKCLLSKGKKIYPPYVHLCIHIKRGCVYLPCQTFNSLLACECTAYDQLFWEVGRHVEGYACPSPRDEGFACPLFEKEYIQHTAVNVQLWLKL